MYRLFPNSSHTVAHLSSRCTVIRAHFVWCVRNCDVIFSAALTGWIHSCLISKYPLFQWQIRSVGMFLIVLPSSYIYHLICIWNLLRRWFLWFYGCEDSRVMFWIFFLTSDCNNWFYCWIADFDFEDILILLGIIACSLLYGMGSQNVDIPYCVLICDFY